MPMGIRRRDTMAESLFPMRPTDIDPEREPRMITLDDSGAMFEALSSRTAREMIAALEAEPMTASALAGHVDTSLQNASYHLDRLSAAGLVEVVGTSFSERGNEMDLYAPTSAPLLICVSDEEGEHDVAGIVENEERSDFEHAGSVS